MSQQRPSRPPMRLTPGVETVWVGPSGRELRLAWAAVWRCLRRRRDGQDGLRKQLKRGARVVGIGLNTALSGLGGPGGRAGGGNLQPASFHVVVCPLRWCLRLRLPPPPLPATAPHTLCALVESCCTLHLDRLFPPFFFGPVQDARGHFRFPFPRSDAPPAGLTHTGCPPLAFFSTSHRPHRGSRPHVHTPPPFFSSPSSSSSSSSPPPPPPSPRLPSLLHRGRWTVSTSDPALT